jgi:hypothetical protein
VLTRPHPWRTISFFAAFAALLKGSQAEAAGRRVLPGCVGLQVANKSVKTLRLTLEYKLCKNIDSPLLMQQTTEAKRKWKRKRSRSRVP